MQFVFQKLCFLWSTASADPLQTIGQERAMIWTTYQLFILPTEEQMIML